MADPKTAQQTPPRDRRRDAESLAAQLFIARFAATMGKLNTDHLAHESFEAARAFYKVADDADVRVELAKASGPTPAAEPAKVAPAG